MYSCPFTLELNKIIKVKNVLYDKQCIQNNLFYWGGTLSILIMKLVLYYMLILSYEFFKMDKLYLNQYINRQIFKLRNKLRYSLIKDKIILKTIQRTICKRCFTTKVVGISAKYLIKKRVLHYQCIYCSKKPYLHEVWVVYFFKNNFFSSRCNFI